MMFNKRDASEERTPLYGKIDERTKAVVYQGDAYTGRFLLFAILIDVFIRGIKLFEPLTASNWDLLFLVIAGGLISTAFQVKNRVLFNKPYFGSFLFVIIIMALSALVALMLIIFLK